MISQQDLESLLELFDRSEWREMRVQGHGVELFVSKDPNARLTDPVTAIPRSVAQVSVQAPAATPVTRQFPPERAEVPGTSGTLHVTATTQAHWVPV